MSASRERSRERAPRREPATAIFVRNLPYDARPSDVEQVFEKHGRLSDVYLPKDYNSGRIRGFAYVKYESQADADKVMDTVTDVEIAGRTCTLEWAQGARKTPTEMRRVGGPRGSPDRRRRDSSPRRRSPARRRYDSRSRSPPRRRRYSSPSRSRSRSPPREERGRRRARSPSVSRSRSRS